jgi:PKD repeat protein
VKRVALRRSWWRRPAGIGCDRGQSLTELALVFPVILLLTLIALDFGRIYLGYINVQNMARIAANYAANNPLAWGATPDSAVQTRYRSQILEDTTASNCELPAGSGGPAVPDPQFSDTDLDGTSTSLGDTVRVQVSCRFTILTPVISGILGDTVQVTAESDFPVKAGMTAVAGPGGGAGPELVARIAIGPVYSDVHAFYVTGGPDATIAFMDASYGQVPVSWRWDFGDGSSPETAQNPAHTFQCVVTVWHGFCVYPVHLHVDSAADSDTTEIWVYVEKEPLVSAAASPTTVEAGTGTVTFTGTIGDPAGTNLRWEFSDGATATGLTATHVFASTGAAWGLFIVDYPEPITRRDAVAQVNVTVPYCRVPSLIDTRFNDANPKWQATIAPATVHFTGTVRRAAGAPSGNFKITAQSIAAGTNATAPCTSDVYVSAP